MRKNSRITLGPYTRDDIIRVSVSNAGFCFQIPDYGGMLFTQNSNLVFSILHGKKFCVKVNPKKTHPVPMVYLYTEYWEEVKELLMSKYPDREPDIDEFIEANVGIDVGPEGVVGDWLKKFRSFLGGME